MQFLIRAYDGEGKLDELLLTEVWRDAEAIEVHKNSVHFFHNYTERRGYGKNVDKGIRLC